MKILLIGKNGQIGNALAEKLSKISNLTAVGSETVRLENDQSIRTAVLSCKPDLIVNAAAYTSVDGAEKEEDLAFRINATCLGTLNALANEIGASIIHYSTDYVFDGMQTTPYVETARVNPLNAYGRSKAAGERFLLQSAVPALIIRTSWIYAAQGKNFFLTMLDLFRERPSVSVVDDQVGAPTTAQVVADITAQIVTQMNGAPGNYLKRKGGLLHMTCAGQATWFEFASEILRIARERNWPLKVDHLIPIPSDQFPLPALRPKNSRLSLARLNREFGIVPPDWRNALINVFDEMDRHRHFDE